MKHAFLIMAHANYPFLSRIIKKIDHPDNAIFIHIDAKSVFTEQDKDLLNNACKYSEVCFIDRYKISWGGYSITNCQLRLLETATPHKFDYYHFLSGADFLIKPMHYFRDFFAEHNGYEFVHFCTEDFVRKQYGRVAQYHFFRDLCGRDRKNPLLWINAAAVIFQRKILRVNRLKAFPDFELKCGSQWCSITHGFAEYLLSKESIIRKMFKFSSCSDELFLQTILHASPFAEHVYSSNMRSIDWSRGDPSKGSPYTYTIEDYDLLINSENLICRKVTDQTPEGEALIKKLENIGVPSKQ